MTSNQTNASEVNNSSSQARTSHETGKVQSISYSYKGNPISFHVDGNVMISATHMARCFPKHKQPLFWLSNQQTKDYLNELSKLRFLSLADLVRVIRGGTNPGTWMHEDVALEFARWLSPSFAIWCNDRIKEILISRQNNLPIIPKREIPKEYTAMEVLKEMFEGTKEKQIPQNNLYLYSILKGCYEFIIEESKGELYTDLRLTGKINSAKTLFWEDRKSLSKCINLKRN